MIVLLLSAQETESLIAGKSDQALKAYLARSLRMERLLPDETLPVSIRLDQVEGTGREYVAVVRTYATSDEADRAWELPYGD